MAGVRRLQGRPRRVARCGRSSKGRRRRFASPWSIPRRLTPASTSAGASCTRSPTRATATSARRRTSFTTSSSTSPSATTSGGAAADPHRHARGARGTSSPARKAEGPGQVSAEDRERLAALGYVGGNAASMAPMPITLADRRTRCASWRRTRGVGAGGPAPLRRGAAALSEDPCRDPGMSDIWLQLRRSSQRTGDDSGAALPSSGAGADAERFGAVLALGNLPLRLRRLDDAEATHTWP